MIQTILNSYWEINSVSKEPKNNNLDDTIDGVTLVNGDKFIETINEPNQWNGIYSHSNQHGFIVDDNPLDDYSWREELVSRGYAVFDGQKNEHDQFAGLSIDIVRALADVVSRLDLRKQTKEADILEDQRKEGNKQ